jgi:uncharacterized protein (DUF433 family)
MPGPAAKSDPLLAGFYSLKEAAILLGLANNRRLHGWLDGWKNSASGPVIMRDFPEGAVSFLDLMELRFVDHFTRQGVPLQTIRKSAERARLQWGVNHPLALSNAKYLTDRRKIFGQVAEEEGDRRTWDMATNQLEMWAAIESIIVKGVEFSPATELARLWRPRSDCPNVFINPKIAFGRPSIGERGIPTVALYRQWRAEDGNGERVASWFHVKPEDVTEAVEFELLMAA